MPLKKLLLASAAFIAYAQEAPIRREGAYWVQVLTGSIPLPAGSKLKVETRGPITVQGGPSDGISYRVKKRVRANSEQRARALLSAGALRADLRGGVATIALAELWRDAAVSAEISVTSRPDLHSSRLETRGGDIQVYDLRGAVQAESGGGLIQMDRIGSDVVARTGGGEIRLGEIAGSIRCFSGGGLIRVGKAGKESWLETAGGDILVQESKGPLHTSTAGGNIHVNRAAATVVARTAGGRIEVTQADGIVLADNSGGSIAVGTAAGARLASAGGSIRLRGSSGSLNAVTDVGSILAELVRGARLQDSQLSTGAGDITVYIPSNIPLTVRALSEAGSAGRIVSEFSEILVRQAAMESRDGLLAEGALNGGGPVLRLTSTGGTIYLKRQQ